MHWLTEPGTSVTGGDAHHRSRPARSCATIPGVRNCGSHIGQALLADEVYGVNFGENWISVDPDGRLRRRPLAAVQRDGRRLPRPLPRRADLPAASASRRCSPARASRSSCASTGPTWRSCARRPRRSATLIAQVDGVVDVHVELQVDVPQIAGRGRPGRGPAVRAQAGRRPPAAATLVASEEVGDIFTAGKAYDVHVWSIPRRAAASTTSENLPIDTPAAARSGSSDVADVRVAPTPNAIKREHAVAAHRRRRQRARARPRRRSSSDVEDAARGRSRSRASTTPRCSASRPSGRRRSGPAAAASAIAAAIGDLPAAAGGIRQLAAGDAHLPDAADRRSWAGCWPRRLGDGVISLGSLVGFLTVLGIAARNGIMLISHFQHLEREEGDAVRPGAGAARRAGAARADPDDRAGDRRSPWCRSSSPAASPATRSSTRWRSSSWAAWSPRRC